MAGGMAGNVEASGVSAADLRGHSLAPSYLRVKESRNLIIQNIKSAFVHMKYPIPFFDSAATVEYLSAVRGKSTASFDAKFVKSNKDVTDVAERSDGDGRYDQYIASCYRVRQGTIEIQATTIAEGGSTEFKASGYVGSKDSSLPCIWILIWAWSLEISK